MVNIIINARLKFIDQAIPKAFGTQYQCSGCCYIF
jgi:hypothetical protein